MRRMSFLLLLLILPRGAKRSGGGGPSAASAASEGWWWGRSGEAYSSAGASFSAGAPSTILLRKMVPLPRFAGKEIRAPPPRVTLFLRPLRRVGEHLVGVLETGLALGDVEADGDDLLHHRGLLVGRQADQLAVLGPDLALLVVKILGPGQHLASRLVGIGVDDGLQILGQAVEPFLRDERHREDGRLPGLGDVFGGVPVMHGGVDGDGEHG